MLNIGQQVLEDVTDLLKRETVFVQVPYLPGKHGGLMDDSAGDLLDCLEH